MKARLMAGVLAVAVAVSFASAQELTPVAGAGSKAMLFTFSGLSTLGAGAYNGGFGAKYFLSSALALRASLQGSYANQKVLTSLTSGGKDGKNAGSTIGITLGGEYHLTIARVSPFIGGMVNFSMTNTTIIPPVNVVGQIEYTYDNVNTALGYTPNRAFGVGGIAGLEFFITKELSLGAEYQLGYAFPLGYESVTTQVNGTVTTETKVKQVGITRVGISNAGTLTLAVYF